MDEFFKRIQTYTQTFLRGIDTFVKTQRFSLLCAVIIGGLIASMGTVLSMKYIHLYSQNKSLTNQYGNLEKHIIELNAKMNSIQTLVDYDSQRTFVINSVNRLIKDVQPKLPFERRQEIGKGVYDVWDLYQIPPSLSTAYIRTESNFDPSAVSDMGAIGLSQVMPTTGIFIARSLDNKTYTVDTLYEPYTNVVIGGWYLKELMVQYKRTQPFGDVLHNSLSAYNQGPGTINKKLKDRQVHTIKTSYSRLVLKYQREHIEEYDLF